MTPKHTTRRSMLPTHLASFGPSSALAISITCSRSKWRPPAEWRRPATSTPSPGTCEANRGIGNDGATGTRRRRQGDGEGDCTKGRAQGTGTGTGTGTGNGDGATLKGPQGAGAAQARRLRERESRSDEGAKAGGSHLRTGQKNVHGKAGAQRHSKRFWGAGAPQARRRGLFKDP